MGQKDLECHKRRAREPEALQLCIIMKLDTQDKADGRQISDCPFFLRVTFRVYYNKCEVENLDQMSIKTSCSDWISRQQYKLRATE